MSKIEWKLAKGKTWRQKLEDSHPNHGKVVPLSPVMRKRLGGGSKMLIPRPLDVDTAIRKVPKGRLITTAQLREELARDSTADCTCPLTTGLFIRIVAETAEEDLRAGKKRITPYWRTIRDDGKLLEKLPGGVEAQAAKLRAEGLVVEPGRGKQPPKVQHFERYLVQTGR